MKRNKFMGNISDIDEKKALNEILDYIKANVGMSYYDIKELAYTTENEAWIKVLEDKPLRAIVAEAAKQKRKADCVPYNREHIEAKFAAATAKIHYKDEQEIKLAEKMEDSVELKDK